MVQGRFFDRFLDRLENRGSRSLNPELVLWVSFRTDTSRVHIPAGSFVEKLENRTTLVTTHNPRESKLTSKSRLRFGMEAGTCLHGAGIITNSGLIMEHGIHFQALLYTHCHPIMDDNLPDGSFLSVQPVPVPMVRVTTSTLGQVPGTKYVAECILWAQSLA
jgi:hypothetical protein